MSLNIESAEVCKAPPPYNFVICAVAHFKKFFVVCVHAIDTWYHQVDLSVSLCLLLFFPLDSNAGAAEAATLDLVASLQALCNLKVDIQFHISFAFLGVGS